MLKEKWFIDHKRSQVKGRFYEMKKPGQNDPPRYVLCSLEHYEFRSDGRRRSEREKINLLLRLYQEKLTELQAKDERQVEEKKKNTKGLYIRTIMQQWIDQEVAPNSKSVTAREYMRTCTLYLENVGDHPIREFRKHHATSFQSGLQKHGLSEAGIRKHQTHLQVFLNWAYSEEHLEKPVRLNKVRVVLQGPAIYTRSEVEILQASIEKALAEAPTPFQKRCITNHLRAFMVARHAVLRCGEILTLPLRFVLLDEGVLRVTAVPEIGWVPKTRQERVLPLNPKLRSFLDMDLRDRGSDEQWFLDDGTGGRAYASNSQLSQVFRRYLKRTDLEQPGRKPLHALRSTGITGMLSAGGKLDFVMRIAGHSNPQTTLNHYVRAENFDLRDTVSLLSNPPENGFIGGR